MFEILDSIEKEFGYIFDTRLKIQKGFLLGVNKYILQYENSEEFKQKGFKKETTKIVIEFFIYCLKENIFVFDNSSIFFLIYTFLIKRLENHNVFDFMLFQKNGSDRKFYYFSKNPQYFNGAYIGGKHFNGAFPVTLLDFIKLQNFSFPTSWDLVCRFHIHKATIRDKKRA